MSRRRGDRVRLEGTAGRSRGMEVWPPCEALEEGGRPRWCPQEVHFSVGVPGTGSDAQPLLHQRAAANNSPWRSREGFIERVVPM